MGRTQLLIFIGVAILLLIAGSLIFGRKPAEPAPATLELWGIGDDAEVWDQIQLGKAVYNRPVHSI